MASALLDALWRQVRGERGRERGREAFDDEMLGNDAFVQFAVDWWPPLDAATVLGWLRDPDFLARVGDGVVSHEDQVLLLKSWGGDLSIEDVPLHRRAALRPRRRAAARRPRTASTPTTSAATWRS